jgi:hypothetical protein
MFESFFHPGYVLAGCALISLPIIIHLINRMRFKKIKWAAMEFLLKSQKKNRRRLIIEQLILLALRCLLILLAVLLVSRYLGFSLEFHPKNTQHYILLDDSLSMTDHWRDEGDDKDSFRLAKELIVKEIAKNVLQARTAQNVVVVTLSDTNRRVFDQRLNDQSIQDLQKALEDLECTFLRIDLSKGVEAAKEMLDKVPQDQRVLHIVSDFRQRDWSEPEAAALNKMLDDIGRAGIKINLVDTAHPYRNDLQKTPLHHDNLAVIDLQPETRIAARDLPVQFTVTVTNYGTSERKNIRVAVKVNGSERLEASTNLTIKGGGTKSGIFQVSFDKLGFNQISANLENEESGLQGDNVRYAVVDVRRQVPVLVIDGDPSNGLKPGGDTYHLQALLTSAKGYQVTPRGVRELEQPNLDQYASIYLLNVGTLSELAVKNLDTYVKNGGSAAFFLGEKVRADFYNAQLYKQGKGVFPAPLKDRPQPPLSEDEMQPNMLDLQLKLFVRNENHPIFAEVWKDKYRPVFAFLPIRRYFPVERRNWTPAPGLAEELATLPNQRSMSDYARDAQEIVDTLNQAAAQADNDKFKAGLANHARTIRDTLLGDKPLYELANALDALLKDKGDTEKPDKPSMVEFFNQPEYQKLRGRIDKFRQDVQLGDPYVISQIFGKGRVVAFFGTLGLAWNSWAGQSPASPTFPPVMVELQKFLTSGGGDTTQIGGTPLTLEVDATRFDSKMRCFYQPESRDTDAVKAGTSDADKASGPIDKGEVLGTEKAGRITFTFDGAQKPGLYRFELPLRTDKGGELKTETRAFVFNIDPAEGDLRRAARDDLERAKTDTHVRNPGSNWGIELANRQNDLSEWPWFYLVFLVILVIEQALAVHLSFHLKGVEPAATIQAPRQETATAA